MKPSFSVTFTLDGEQWQVPFLSEAPAREYAHQVPRVYPDASNVVLNDLDS